MRHVRNGVPAIRQPSAAPHCRVWATEDNHRTDSPFRTFHTMNKMMLHYRIYSVLPEDSCPAISAADQPQMICSISKQHMNCRAQHSTSGTARVGTQLFLTYIGRMLCGQWRRWEKGTVVWGGRVKQMEASAGVYKPSVFPFERPSTFIPPTNS